MLTVAEHQICQYIETKLKPERSPLIGCVHGEPVYRVRGVIPYCAIPATSMLGHAKYSRIGVVYLLVFVLRN